MSYNAGADIIPADLLGQSCPAAANNFGAWTGYARLQRMTEQATKDFVFAAYDSSYISYGADSPDFPLCLDFARVSVGDCLRYAIKQGLAARPAIFVLEYTKLDGNRHAIVAAALSDGRWIFYEPQTGEWMTEPKDAASLDSMLI